MSNYVEHNGRVAFHPSYYVKEIFEETGLSQKDFAERLDTTPKNFSVFLKGKQRLSIDLANKLSRMLGTSVEYWLNLQRSYDEMYAEFSSERELQAEKEILKLIDYKYFHDNFGLPSFLRKTEERVKALREFLSVASLTVLMRPNLAVNFRSFSSSLSKSNIINANAMVQTAINFAIRTEAPKYNQAKFENAVKFALTLTKKNDNFFSKIKDSFHEAGVVLIVLPNLKNSCINGATKRLGGKILLMINGRFSNTFEAVLFHETEHILKKNLGITFNNKK
ncbi:MAG: HigA family addiction module antidote protein [Synergistaceae bacterium]|nr:HigA family addiction module antidote protein [Synergistaceae bacterium]